MAAGNRPLRLLAILILTPCLTTYAADRIPNTSFLIDLESTPGTDLHLKQVFQGQVFRAPIMMTPVPGTEDEVVLAFHGGYAVRYRLKIDYSIDKATRFLSLETRVYVHKDAQEAGLIGLALHPFFQENGKVYVAYVRSPEFSRVSEFRMSSDGSGVVDLSTERTVLETRGEKPFHFGGHLEFGADGFLYISTGDHLEALSAQDKSDLRGSILRIDVDRRTGSLPYGIPSDNPFVGNQNGWREEIWATGFRNPWRFGFDETDGRLWLGDVGQSQYEEVNIVRKGENYGWPVWEGERCSPWFGSCDSSNYVFPTHEYKHSIGVAVIGGRVYNGPLEPLRGRYLFGDYVSRSIWALQFEGDTVIDVQEVAVSPASILSFGLGPDGEMFVLTPRAVFVMEENPESVVPRRISASGLFSQIEDQVPGPGIIPYSVNAELWSDGASKTRFIALPGDATIDVKSNGDWEFPPGAVLVKNFYLDLVKGVPDSRRIIETRFLIKHSTGDEWSGLSYKWNEDGTDAVLLETSHSTTHEIEDPDTGETRSHTYYFPSRNDCRQCHTQAAGFVLGATAAQLNKTSDGENQLDAMVHKGLFNREIGSENLPRLPDYTDASVPLGERARAYLDANCSQCHRPGGTGRGTLDLRYSTPLKETRLLDQLPTFGDLGTANARLLASSEPDSSVLVHRMETTNDDRMPPLATSRVDVDGVRLIREWIDRMPVRPPWESVPETIQLGQNFPNPFNPSTTIRFGVDSRREIKLRIYSVLGQVVRTLTRQVYDPGTYSLIWDGRDDGGTPMSSGLYIYQIESESGRVARRMLLLR